MILFRKLLEGVGIEPDRILVSWISAAEGRKFADTVATVVERIRALGPCTALRRDYDEAWLSDLPPGSEVLS